MQRILITGGSGFLGSLLGKILSTKYEVYVGHLHSKAPAFGVPLQFDIRDADGVSRAFETAHPDCVVHTAALTKPDYCETKSDETRAVNVMGTSHIVHACNTHGTKLIHISTDLVFDGKRGHYSEDDMPHGINEYSRSKIAAEEIVLADSPGAVILRLSVLYGPRHSTHPSFLDEILEHWNKGKAMGFFTDQYRNPTFAPQVADAIERIVARPEASGVFHLGGADRLSRYEFAAIAARLVGAPAEFVGRASMFDHQGPAQRPPDCSLISEKIFRTFGVAPARCVDGLSELVRQGHVAKFDRT